jgi:hypothetical protein
MSLLKMSASVVCELLLVLVDSELAADELDDAAVEPVELLVDEVLEVPFALSYVMASAKLTLPSLLVSALSKLLTISLSKLDRLESLVPISDSWLVSSSLVNPVSLLLVSLDSLGGGGGGGIAPSILV